ncbi:DUF4918 family protein [Pricia sp. S334]|uniref:DUF4918 family protein n=1 Tax=Pricia mediterranea TaxID=3076079 RepID=A0ABU3L8V1_9FLAO|nr:uracil-DNA glycosylase family protein [Pricia sp. S334]MDT7829497.1 DUF4918 family protein [Pricia sp. S334]
MKRNHLHDRSSRPKETFSAAKSVLLRSGEPSQEHRKNCVDLDAETIRNIEKNLGLTFVPENGEAGNVCLARSPEVRDEYRETFQRQDILDYVYAVVHSPRYLKKNKELSNNDTYKISYPNDQDRFWMLAGLGAQLRQLHRSDSVTAVKKPSREAQDIIQTIADIEKSFANQVIDFHSHLRLTKSLPKEIKVLNPFQENEEVLSILFTFYRKFYDDRNPRKLILGINPGRLGAGVTGIPFTDTKRLSEICGIKMETLTTHEPSSVFIYDLIEKYGGPEKFYGRYYINSVCPLGFVQENKKGNWVNCNYYDYKSLFLALKEFIISSLRTQIDFGIDTGTCYVLGKKNAQFLTLINDEMQFFDSIVAFDHPRYIVQYKSKYKQDYLARYLRELT